MDTHQPLTDTDQKLQALTQTIANNAGKINAFLSEIGKVAQTLVTRHNQDCWLTHYAEPQEYQSKLVDNLEVGPGTWSKEGRRIRGSGSDAPLNWQHAGIDAQKKLHFIHTNLAAYCAQEEEDVPHTMGATRDVTVPISLDAARKIFVQPGTSFAEAQDSALFCTPTNEGHLSWNRVVPMGTALTEVDIRQAPLDALELLRSAWPKDLPDGSFDAMASTIKTRHAEALTALDAIQQQAAEVRNAMNDTWVGAGVEPQQRLRR